MNTVITPPQAETVTLYYREGFSDKVYQCGIEPSGDLFVVNFAYGRRGSTLSTGTKTSSPVEYETAKKAYDKLVKEKTAKGYTPGEDGTPYQHSEKQTSGVLPQLLNPIEEEEAVRLLKDPAWCMQEKKDGRRTLIEKNGDTIIGINRKGLVIGLPQGMVESARLIPRNFVMDGEAVGDVLFVFDLLRLDGDNLESLPYEERLKALWALLHPFELLNIIPVPTERDTAGKTQALERLRKEKREGVVFKQLDAPYKSGRPNSGGPQLKHKFYATLSAVVSQINAQRSVEIRLLNGDGWVPAGNVTIPPNEVIPKVGWVVEVRYLYAIPESGCVYQPVYLGSRKDIAQHECVCSQLKFKPQDDE